MANKYYRQNFRFGGKSNIQKIAEAFGPKKKVKKEKTKKRMMASKGSKPDFLDLILEDDVAFIISLNSFNVVFGDTAPNFFSSLNLDSIIFSSLFVLLSQSQML